MLYPGAVPERIHRICPGVDRVTPSPQAIDRAHALIAPFLRDPDRPMILAVARPVAKKNLAGLIDMVGRSDHLRTNANLVILPGLRDDPDGGEAEQRTVIRDLFDAIDRHDLHGHVAYPKRHTHDDVHALYVVAAATRGVFANPAFTEPFGLTLIEAASHGLPVVATSHGGPSDIVDMLGHGLVADPTDRTAFASAIEGLLSDRAQWRTASRNGLARSETLTWDSYADTMIAVARSAISARHGAVVPIQPLRHPPAALVLSDIDNTLTGCAVGASRFARHLRRDPDRLFGIATGRSLQEARRILGEWRLPDPDVMITSVGSEIYWRDGDSLNGDADYAAMLAIDWFPEAIMGALAAVTGLTPQPPVEQRRFKLSFHTTHRDVAASVSSALSGAGIRARVVHSHATMLDILPSNGGKGNAMKHVARTLGLPLDHVFAIGDSGNDRDMLEACPNAVIVANHDADISGLRGRPNVYLARRSHAGGALEGILAHRRRRRTMLATGAVR